MYESRKKIKIHSVCHRCQRICKTASKFEKKYILAVVVHVLSDSSFTSIFIGDFKALHRESGWSLVDNLKLVKLLSAR